MTYSQNANPNATNSELDSKRIITHKELTSPQKDELIDQYVDIVVDNMSEESLIELATEYVTNSFDRLTDSEIKERVECYDEELYEEIVDNVTNETVLDTNNNGGKF